MSRDGVFTTIILVVGVLLALALSTEEAVRLSVKTNPLIVVMVASIGWIVLAVAARMPASMIILSLTLVGVFSYTMATLVLPDTLRNLLEKKIAYGGLSIVDGIYIAKMEVVWSFIVLFFARLFLVVRDENGRSETAGSSTIGEMYD